MQKIKEKIIDILSEQLNLDDLILEIPPQSEMGDLALPCHQFSKSLKKSPTEIAQDFSTKINHSLITKTEVAGPYLNIFLNRVEFARSVFEENGKRENKNEKASPVGLWPRVSVEYLSANPNKPLHIGQARNICIGDSMIRMSKFLGYQTDAINYGDDSGVNVGYNIVGHLYYGYPLETELKFDHYCGKIYTEIRQKEEDVQFKEKLTETLLAIEKKSDLKISALHKDYTQKCAIAQFESCWKMNVFFDLINWETDILHLDLFDSVFEKLKASGFVKYAEEGEAKGCWILDLSQEEEFKGMERPYQILVKSDGVATYVAKDIAYAIWKLGFLDKNFFYKKLIKQPNNQVIFTTTSEEKDSEKKDFGNYHKSFAVIDNRQSHAQNVVKKALEILGYLKQGRDYHHLSYGVVYLTPKTLLDFGFTLSDEEKSEKRLPFSSRKGWFITIDETFEILKKKAKQECLMRNEDKDLKWIDDTTEKIALGAMRYYLLKTDISQDIVFDIDSALDLRGDTGMYILYTYARISSIFEKSNFSCHSRVMPKADPPLAEKRNLDLDYSLLQENLEWEIIKEISKKEEVIENAFNNLTPNIVCGYLFNLCQLFNTYYAQASIIKSEDSLKIARLNLLAKLQSTLKETMNLIGMIEIDKV